ncbi:P-loop containing nucleoside triphosphate hydrolase protein [Zopfochytrium polystomum]|nr:P-loop containing nucleoside triphosphate hydrolase protein [Zopfochytrium polystomum]
MRLSDLRTPAEWYPAARAIKRKIIMHVGPTNSGKTHHALERLKKAESGVYAGPLRLLAHEIYDRMNSAGIPFNLLTGEMRRESAHIARWSATVEMTPLHRPFEVAVIDEIQMIADEQRGWAWTQALLGLQASEIHLCGEPTAVDLVKRICETTGDSVEVRTYKRLSGLEVRENGFHGQFSKLKMGDCLVAFTRRNIFMLRKIVEEKTQIRCAVVYGNLPPEVRAEQARLFNDQANTGYGILVASDAIGMGLNLNIRRVIFSTMEKFNGQAIVPLTDSQIKQIGGRAGRFGTKFEIGEVTTLVNKDTPRLKQAMAKKFTDSLRSAGLHPTLEQMELFERELPGLTFAELLDKFEILASVNNEYFLCNLETQKQVADLIQSVALSLQDRYTFISAPTNAEDVRLAALTLRMAKAVANGDRVDLEGAIQLPNRQPTSSEALRELEGMHKAIVLYMWLA